MTYTNFRQPSKEPTSTVATMNNLICGVGAAKLSRDLPIDLKMLICDLAKGYVVECLGALGTEFKEHGKKKEIEPGCECEEERFYLTPPPKGDWTCEACLNFMKKYNPEAWEKRSGLEFVYKRERKPKPAYVNARWFAKKKAVEVENMEPESSGDSEVEEKARNAIVVRKTWTKRPRGQVRRKITPCPSSRRYGMEKIRKKFDEECWHLPRSIAGGPANICCVCLERRRVKLL